jgi:hypothetical protein
MLVKRLPRQQRPGRKGRDRVRRNPARVLGHRYQARAPAWLRGPIPLTTSSAV